MAEITEKASRVGSTGAPCGTNCGRKDTANTPVFQRAFLLMAPGCIRTALGGPDAPFTAEEGVLVGGRWARPGWARAVWRVWTARAGPGSRPGMPCQPTLAEA